MQLSTDFFYVYRYPTFALAGMEAVSWAFNMQAPNITKQRYKLSKVDPALANTLTMPQLPGRRKQLESAGHHRQLPQQEPLLEQQQQLHHLHGSRGFLKNMLRKLAAEGQASQAGAGLRPPAGWRPPDLLILNQGIFWMQPDNPMPQLVQLFK